jgi:hypothetical protein
MVRNIWIELIDKHKLLVGNRIREHSLFLKNVGRPT